MAMTTGDYRNLHNPLPKSEPLQYNDIALRDYIKAILMIHASAISDGG